MQSSVCLNLFNFGVPLEDICPDNDIHPTLKNLLCATHLAIQNDPLELEDIMDHFQGTIGERLSLKDRLLNGQLQDNNDELSSGKFLWLLRHFLGLLPLPLFSRYNDDRICRWDQLAIECKHWIKYRHFNLNSDIARNLVKLPRINLIFIEHMMHVFRDISIKKQKCKRDSLYSIVIYFSPSLFSRPYRPGYHVTSSDKIYFTLLHYMIVHWPQIKRWYCKEVDLTSIYNNERKRFGIVRDFYNYPLVPSILTRRPIYLSSEKSYNTSSKKSPKNYKEDYSTKVNLPISDNITTLIGDNENFSDELALPNKEEFESVTNFSLTTKHVRNSNRDDAIYEDMKIVSYNNQNLNVNQTNEDLTNLSDQVNVYPFEDDFETYESNVHSHISNPICSKIGTNDKIISDQELMKNSPNKLNRSFIRRIFQSGKLSKSADAINKFESGKKLKIIVSKLSLFKRDFSRVNLDPDASSVKYRKLLTI